MVNINLISLNDAKYHFRQFISILNFFYYIIKLFDAFLFESKKIIDDEFKNMID